MKALILAAGRGKRLWPFTSDRPKCLLDIGGVTILEHQLANLKQAGVDEVVLVCGYGVDRIRDQLGDCRIKIDVRLLYNPFYTVADNLVSLWAARADMDGDFILLNGDNVFHPDILESFMSSSPRTRLLINCKDSYDADDMKVELSNSALRRIGKSLPADRIDAESIGIMQFCGSGANTLLRTLEECVMEDSALGGLFVEAIQKLANDGVEVFTVNVGRLPWMDVDTPEDLAHVRSNLHLFENRALRESGRQLA